MQGIGKYIIERTDSIQIETLLKTGDKSKFKVKWINDCEYELIIMEGPEVIMKYYEGKTLAVRLTETFHDHYTFEARLKGTEIKMTQALTRISK